MFAPAGEGSPEAYWIIPTAPTKNPAPTVSAELAVTVPVNDGPPPPEPQSAPVPVMAPVVSTWRHCAVTPVVEAPVSCRDKRVAAPAPAMIGDPAK